MLVVLNFFLNFDKKKNEIIISRATYAPWKFEKEFIALYSKFKFFTLLDERRLFTIYNILDQLKNTNGDIMDVGCLRGGIGMMMSKLNKKEELLIDTFADFMKKKIP